VTTRVRNYVDFPYLRQAVRIERRTTTLDGTPLRQEIAFGITSLSPTQASQERLLELNRGHWGIENKIHWVRDVTFDEDRSQIRKRTGAHLMATLRNFAIGLLRLAGATNIAAAVRYCASNIARPLSFFGL
jgi:predicted transposase YbfD/YdcC